MKKVETFLLQFILGIGLGLQTVAKLVEKLNPCGIGTKLLVYRFFACTLAPAPHL